MAEEIRLNKFLSEAGVASRRGADKLIEEGRVEVDGKVALLGMTIASDVLVLVDKKPVTAKKEQIIVAFNKPRGIVCTASKKDPDNIYTVFRYPKLLKYVGRLDKQSRGLILFTDDGELAESISKAGNAHEKEYEVKTNRPVTDRELKLISEGPDIEIDGKVYQTRKCKVKRLAPNRFRIVLTQGFNRQIRRMCEVVGVKVADLRRIRVMNIKLNGLKEGAYRELGEEEKAELLRIVNKEN